MKTILGVVLALVLGGQAEAQTRRDPGVIPPTTPAAATIRPFCSIPPAMIQQQPNTYIVRATNVIVMTNSGRPCGGALGSGVNDLTRQVSAIGHMELIRQPSHGSVTLTPPRFAYTPEPGYLGPDSFAIRVPSAEWTFNVNVVTPDQAR